MTNEHDARAVDAVTDPPSEITDPLVRVTDTGEGPTDPSGEVEPTLEGALPSSESGPGEMVAQIQRTDDALRAWRSESVRRRVSWDAEQAAEDARLATERRRVARFALSGATAGALLGLVAVAIGLATRSSEPGPLRAHPPAIVAPPVAEPAVVAERAPVSADPVTEPALAEPSVGSADPVVTAGLAATTEPPATPTVPATPEVAAVATLEPEPRPVDLVGTVAGSAPADARVWTDRSYVWVSFVHPNPWALTLRWLDARGQSALEPMGCARIECRAGRSHTRIDEAVARGAAPGTWTVQACADGSCAELGRFEVPASR